MHDRYSEDGLDGGNGSSWMGIFRVVVEAEPLKAATESTSAQPGK